jgi:hypothetical protein
MKSLIYQDISLFPVTRSTENSGRENRYSATSAPATQSPTVQIQLIRNRIHISESLFQIQYTVLLEIICIHGS